MILQDDLIEPPVTFWLGVVQGKPRSCQVIVTVVENYFSFSQVIKRPRDQRVM